MKVHIPMLVSLPQELPSHGLGSIHRSSDSIVIAITSSHEHKV